MKKLLFSLLVPAMMLAGCSKNDNPTPDPDGRVQAQFKSGITAMPQTKVGGETGNLWDGGEQVGIFMLKAGGTTAADVLTTNAAYTASAGETATFTPAGDPIYYPTDGSDVQFIAYYPYNAAVTDSYTLPVSVADQSNPSNIDVLYAEMGTQTYSKASGTVTLGFAHKLAKVVYNIQPGDDLTEADLAGATVTIGNQQTEATMSYDGTLTVTAGTPTAITGLTVADGTTGAAIVLPGATDGVEFSVTVGGNTYKALATEQNDITAWESGNQYTYDITLGAKGSATATLTGTIEAWTDNGSTDLTGTLTGGEEEGPTIADVLAAGEQDAATVSGTVVAINTSGMMIADETGAIQIYGQKPDVAINDAITATGSTAMYHGVLEFKVSAATDITVTGTGSYTLPEPIAMDGAAVTAYVATAMDNAAVYQYVTYTGTLNVSGNYYDVAIPGTSTQGNLTGADAAWAAFNGQTIVVTGWLMGGTTSFMDTMATSVAPDTTSPYLSVDPTSLTFAAEGETKTATITSANLTAAISTSIAGDGAGQFSASVSGNTVSVVAISNDDTAAKTATLTLTSGAVTATIALTQNPKSTGNDTKGIYTSIAPFVVSADNSANGVYTLGTGSTVNGSPISGMKFGSSSKAGFYSATAGVAGNTLGFYAMAWNGKNATLYVKVDNGAVQSFTLTSNTGVANNPPFTITEPAGDPDYYTMDITGMTASSTISFSTSPNFDAASSSTARGIVFGIQIF